MQCINFISSVFVSHRRYDAFLSSDDLLIVKKYECATPAMSSPPSRPPFQTKEKMIKNMLVEAPRHHGQAKKNVSHFCILQATYFLIRTICKALVRDGFRCMASDRYDTHYVLKNLELQQEVWNPSTMAPLCGTQCAHIFPESMDISGSDEDGAKVRIHVPSILAIANFLLARVCQECVDYHEPFRLRRSSR